VPANLHMSALPSAQLADLVSEWTARLRSAPELFLAREVYGGRGFREAVAAAEALDADIIVVSAGLGLIRSSAKIPAYACTTIPGSADSVAARVLGDFSAPNWWAALKGKSTFNSPLLGNAGIDSGLILAALSDAYIELVSDELLALPSIVLSNLRLFTRAPLRRVEPGLRPFVMPYDDRLDGPDSLVPGTRGDFAGRALRHFATTIVSDGDLREATDHAKAVAAAIANWRFPVAIERVRHDDATILKLIRAHWSDERGCTLARFRHEFKVACEQGRFSALHGVVRAERA
jgi:hypothetical protein